MNAFAHPSPPIYAAPTRSWPTSARPPPAGHLESDAPSEYQELLTGGSPLDGAVPYQKVKRVGHGFRNFDNYRLRLLLLHCGVSWQTHRTARLPSRSHTWCRRAARVPRMALWRRKDGLVVP